MSILWPNEDMYPYDKPVSNFPYKPVDLVKYMVAQNPAAVAGYPQECDSCVLSVYIQFVTDDDASVFSYRSVIMGEGYNNPPWVKQLINWFDGLAGLAGNAVTFGQALHDEGFKDLLKQWGLTSLVQ